MTTKISGMEGERLRYLLYAAHYAADRRGKNIAYLDGGSQVEIDSYPPVDFAGRSTGAVMPSWLIASACTVFILCGSGGTVSSLEPRNLTGGRTTLETALFTRTERGRTLSAKDCIRALKSILGLTLSDLAEIMLVGRPAVYDWLDGAQPRQKSLARLWELHGVAQLWSQMTKVPLGSRVRLPFYDGHTLYSLLTSRDLVMSDIQRDLRLLAQSANQAVFAEQTLSISARLRKAGFKPAPAETRAATRQQLSPSWVDDE